MDITFLDGDSYSSPPGSYIVAYELTGTALSGSVPVVTFSPVSTGQVVGGSDIGLIGTTEGVGFLVIEIFDPLGVVSWNMTSVMGSMSGGTYQFAPFSAISSSVLRKKGLLTAEEVKRNTKLKKIERYQNQFRLPQIRGPAQEDPAAAPIQVQQPDYGKFIPTGVAAMGSPYSQALANAYKK